MASLAFFLAQPTLARQLSPLDWLAALLAAMVHDVGHPGVNNGFLEATRADVAVTYNDQAVLENHHAALAFRLAAREECDWLACLGEEQQRELRETVCCMGLGTLTLTLTLTLPLTLTLTRCATWCSVPR